jgi:hypothetical protein
MIKTASDAKLPLSTRCIAAESLGRLNYAGAAGIDPVEAAVALGQLAIDVCRQELQSSKETGYGVSRRRLKQRLDAVLFALGGDGDADHKGIASLAQEPQQPFLDELQKNIKELSDLLDDKARKDDDMKPPVEDLQKKLEAWLQKKPK